MHQTLFDQAFAHHRAGEWVEASRLYRQLLERDPQHAASLHLLAVLAHKAGKAPLSAHLVRQAAAGASQTLFALGDVLANDGQLDQAIQLYHQLLIQLPHSPAGWNNLGNLHRLNADPDAAIAAFERSLELYPHFTAPLCNLGSALQDQGRIAEAIAAFTRAVDARPDDPHIHSNLVYATLFSPEHDAAAQLAHASQWGDRHERPLLRVHENRPRRPGRWRIGYVSPDFRNHVVGRNVLPILQHHDHQRFEVHCFSTLARHDALTPLFVRTADHWHECASLSDAELEELIRSHDIDILVDLSVHMGGNRLRTFARKPAPLQVTWAGYPGTTGLRSMDYRITDPWLDPPGTDHFYSERSLRLPHSFWCYQPPTEAPDVAPLPAITNGFVTFGCLNNFAKVNASTVELWATVFAGIPASRLLLLCPRGSARTRVIACMQRFGISEDRLEFVEMTEQHKHMQRYHRIDIALDPMPYTGHTTTLDALWMGVPVITLPGETCVSRGSVTALRHVGLSNLIAHSREHYIQTGSALAHDLPRLSDIRRSLRQRMEISPLCDAPVFTASFESACDQRCKDLR